MSTAVERYGRWHDEFPATSGVEWVDFTGPDGTVETRPTFRHQPAALRYDHHGYEAVAPQGEPVLAVRFTPTAIGVYHYRARRGDETVQEGDLQCTPSGHPGYVEISRRDPRYFSYSNGAAYCAIGLNLCSPPRYPLPRGMEHFETADAMATLGVAEYRRWFRLLAEHGGNFCRIWLSNPALYVETETAGELDWRGFARMDAIIDLARQYGIRLKLCFDHFRTFDPGTPFYRKLIDPATGRGPANIDEWLTEPIWRDYWLAKVEQYLARYGNDPTVMAWELWNEMDCVRTSDFAHVHEWTRAMLNAIKCQTPRNLVTNSLGSFDDRRKQRVQDDFHMPEMDFQQVHRYLDQGAPWSICSDPVAFSIEGIQLARRPDRPILLAETGAVNDRHTGPFRYYRMDGRGIIFHDTTYPAFFAGAAGTGHIWHWDSYVDMKDLWRYFAPFAALVGGVQLDAEGFEPVDLSNERAWFLGLKGETTFLGWARNKADRWDAVLRDGHEPTPLVDEVFDLAPLGVRSGEAQLIWPWLDAAGAGATRAAVLDGAMRLPPFRYGVMVRIKHGE